MTEARVVLRGVFGSELGLSVVGLGLVHGVKVDRGAVAITMTLTASGCPIRDVTPAWVREAVLRIPGGERAEVTLTFDPPWTPAGTRTEDRHSP